MTFALWGNLVAKAVLTSGAPRQHSEQLTTMKLLLLLLQCLRSLIHYTTSSPNEAPSLSGHEASTRCPYTVCYRDQINGKDCMLLMSAQTQKTGVIQASSSLRVPAVCALIALFCTEGCMWVYGGEQVW